MRRYFDRCAEEGCGVKKIVRVCISDGPARFNTVGQQQLEQMSMPFVPENTMRKNMWALNLYAKWRLEVLQSGVNDVLDPELLQTIQTNSDILALTNNQLNAVLSVFVLSLKKEDGSRYTSGTLFSVVTALQRHFEINNKRVSFFTDPVFTSLKNCLDNSMQETTRQGVGLIKNRHR